MQEESPKQEQKQEQSPVSSSDKPQEAQAELSAAGKSKKAREAKLSDDLTKLETALQEASSSFKPLFDSLYFQRQHLSTEQCKRFAQLIPMCFDRILPPRGIAMRLNEQEVWKRCKNLALLRHQLPVENWILYCQDMGEVLFNKGYYWPESHLSSVPSDAPTVLSLRERIKQIPTAEQYFIALKKCISFSLSTETGVAASGKVPTAKTEEQMAAKAGLAVAGAVVGLVPFAGSAASGAFGAASVALDVASERENQKEIHRVSRWVNSPQDCEQLAEALALELTEIFLPLLSSSIPICRSSSRLADLSQEGKRAFREFKTGVPQSKPEEWAAAHWKRLRDEFIKQDPVELDGGPITGYVKQLTAPLIAEELGQQPPAEAKAQSAAAAPSSASEIRSWPFVSALQYWREHQQLADALQPPLLARLAAPLTVQVLADERGKRLTEWLQKYDAEVATWSFARILTAQTELMQHLNAPLRWSKEDRLEAIRRLGMLWEQCGKKALERLPLGEWLSGLHTVFLSNLIALQQQEDLCLQPPAASLVAQMRHQYGEYLEKHAAVVRARMIDREEQQEQHQARAEECKKRFREGSGLIQSWLASMGVKDQELKLSPPTKSASDPHSGVDSDKYANPDKCCAAIEADWQQSGFSQIRHYYEEHYRNWQQANRLGQATAASLRTNLMFSLTKAREKLKALCDKEIAAGAGLTRDVQEDQRLLENLGKALTEISSRRSASNQEVVAPQVPKQEIKADQDDKESKRSLPSGGAGLWSMCESAVLAAERELGQAPIIDYAIVGWPEAPGMDECGVWKFGVLLAKTPGNEAARVTDFGHLLGIFVKVQLSCISWPIGMRLQLVMREEDDLEAYINSARVVVIRGEKAGSLLPEYERNMGEWLKSKDWRGTSRARQLACRGLQQLAQASGEVQERCRLDDVLLQLFRLTIYLNIYYGLNPGIPDRMWKALSEGPKPYLLADFVRDLSQGVEWIRRLRTERIARQVLKTPPNGMAPGEVCLLAAADAPIPTGDDPDYYLSWDESEELRWRYRMIIGPFSKMWRLSNPLDSESPIADSLDFWQLDKEPPRGCSLPSGSKPSWSFDSARGFDPLNAWFHHRAVKRWEKGYVPPDQVPELFSMLLRVAVHRDVEPAELRICMMYLPRDWRLTFVQQLERLAPEKRDLLHELRTFPAATGWRVCADEEQQQWQQQIPRLCQPVAEEAKRVASSQPSADVYLEWSESILVAEGWQCEAKPQKRRLLPEVASKLVDEKGAWRKKNNKQGNHVVYEVGGCHFKIEPEMPFNDFYVKEFDNCLGGGGVPNMLLGKLHLPGGETASVLISETVTGIDLEKVLKSSNPREYLDKLSYVSFLRTFLRVLFTCPEDDKSNDYFLVKKADGYWLVRIDNERAFFPVMSKPEAWKIWLSSEINVKSIIFCLDHMQYSWGSHKDAVKIIMADLLRLQPLFMLRHILKEAENMQPAWANLFTREEIEDIFNRSSIPLMLAPGGFSSVHLTRITTVFEAIRSLSNGYKDWSGVTALAILECVCLELSPYGEAHKSLPGMGHTQVLPRFMRAVGKGYTLQEGGLQSSTLRSAVLQSSLNLAAPVEKQNLEQIRDAKAHSPQQELALIEELINTDFEQLMAGLLRRDRVLLKKLEKTPLKLPVSIALWKKLKKRVIKAESRGEMLTRDQWCFLLEAFALTQWQCMDLWFNLSGLGYAELSPLFRNNKGVLKLIISERTKLNPGLFPSIARAFPDLRHLKLDGVEWSQLPAVVFPKLRSLSCRKTKFLRAVHLGELSNLEQLSFANASQLQVIADEKGRPRTLAALQLLDISNCLELHSVHVRGRPRLVCLKDGSMMERTAALKRLGESNGMVFDYRNQSKNVATELRALAFAVKAGLAVRTIDLHNITISDPLNPNNPNAAVMELLDALLAAHPAPPLEVLNLGMVEIGSLGAKKVAKILQKFSLVELNLGRTGIDSSGVIDLVREGLSKNSSLISLVLSGTKDIPEKAAEVDQAWAEFEKHNCSLMHLFPPIGRFNEKLAENNKRFLELINAIKKPDHKAVQQYLHEGRSVNGLYEEALWVGQGNEQKDKFTALMAAIVSQNPEMVRLVCDHISQRYLMQRAEGWGKFNGKNALELAMWWDMECNTKESMKIVQHVGRVYRERGIAMSSEVEAYLQAKQIGALDSKEQQFAEQKSKPAQSEGQHVRFKFESPVSSLPEEVLAIAAAPSAPEAAAAPLAKEGQSQGAMALT